MKPILASASHGRRELFDRYGLDYEVVVSHFDESLVPAESPIEYVKKLALHKAQTVAELHPERIVLGFDTIVLCEGAIIGKPPTIEDAYHVLKSISGKNQSVITGYSVIRKSDCLCIVNHSETILHLKAMSDEFIREYIATHPVTRYAGGYGVQENDALIEIIEGDFDNVVGAPMQDIIRILKTGNFCV